MDLLRLFRRKKPEPLPDLPWPKPLPLPVKLAPVAHKFFDWTHLPDSEIASLEDPERCCNLNTSQRFCIICYHSPDCPRLNHRA